MKRIETLVDDIYRVLSTPTVVPSEDAESFGRSLSKIIVEKLAQPKHTPSLRMSNLGSRCKRQLYYLTHASSVRESLHSKVHLKFLYGDILEALLLFLAKLSGHKVEGEQDELDINGVKGHRDAVIDGVTVDVKSASSQSFKKFEQGLTEASDSFGYVDQLGAYIYAGNNDPIVTEKDRGAFLAIDKQFGTITLDVHKKNGKDYEKVVDETRELISKDQPPKRGFFDEPEGKSGNRRLGTACSYCQFKQECWPGLRTFLYASGPMYLTNVAKLPNVTEVTDARVCDSPSGED